jgi:hypothetical protein
MNTILAGRLDEQARAEQAITALEATGFQREQMAPFFVNPAGQHGENVHRGGWRRGSESNRRTRLCRPLHILINQSDACV